MKKRIAVVAMAAVLSALMAVPGYAGTWIQEGDRWRYARSSSSVVADDWLDLNGKKYYFDNNGFMAKGWVMVKNQWFYLEPEGEHQGELRTGWFQDEGKWYYLSPLDGAMVKNTVVEGRQIGADGVWIPAEGQEEPQQALSVDVSSARLVKDMAEGLKTSGYSIISQGKTGRAISWNNAIRLYGNASFVQYKTEGAYKMLAGEFSPSTTYASDQTGQLTVYGDNGQVLYSAVDIRYDIYPISFVVDVQGQNQVQVVFTQTRAEKWDKTALMIKDLTLYQ